MKINGPGIKTRKKFLAVGKASRLHSDLRQALNGERQLLVLKRGDLKFCTPVRGGNSVERLSREVNQHSII